MNPEKPLKPPKFYDPATNTWYIGQVTRIADIESNTNEQAEIEAEIEMINDTPERTFEDQA